MGRHSGQTIDVLMLEEMKSLKKEIIEEMNLFRETVSGEIKSMKIEIINLGEKIERLNSKNVNATECCNIKQENGSSGQFSGIQMEYFENVLPSLNEDPSLSSGMNITDNNSDGINEPEFEDSMNVDDENVQSCLESASNNSSVSDTESSLEGFNQMGPPILDAGGLWSDESDEENMLPDSNLSLTSRKVLKSDTANNLITQTTNITEENGFPNSNFLPVVVSIKEELGDLNSLRNLSSPATNSNSKKKDVKGLNKKKDSSKRSDGGEMSTSGNQKLKKKCEYCNKEFKRNQDVKRHILSHTGEKPFKCNICDKRFALSFALSNHIRTHTGEKPFQCHKCKKCFSLSCNLRRHIHTHTGHKPFKCPQCGKAFINSYQMKLHFERHSHKKPFKCDQCKKSFANLANMKRHANNTHADKKPFKCLQCEKRFSIAYELKVHLHIHSGEKPFKCPHCTKCFPVVGDLNKHIRVHTGERPFKCPQCSMSFKQTNNLKAHMKTHNKGVKVVE